MLISRSWLDTNTGPWPGNQRPLEKAARKVEVGPPPNPNREEHPYQGTIRIHGLTIYVENTKGSTRSGEDADGNPWSVTMTAHYGEFADTLGMDGDPVDVFVGDNPDSEMAYVVHQKHPGTQVPDEDKCVICCRTAKEAEDLYRSNYERPGFFHGITPWPIDELRQVLRSKTNEGERLDKPAAVRRKMGMKKASPRFLIQSTFQRGKDGELRKAERIPGGLASGKSPKDFDPEALAQGVKVEMEHTDDREVAREIAMDHLTEDPEYYVKLAKMEKSVRYLLKAVIRTPKSADGKVDYDSVPVGAPIWVSVSNPASPLHGRALLITKRPDKQFALTGGSSAKHIKARKHLTMQGGEIRTEEKDEEKLAQRKEIEERNRPRKEAIRSFRKKARAQEKQAETDFMEALGVKRRGLSDEERQKVHDAAHQFAESSGLEGAQARSFAKKMADGIARKEREVQQRKIAHRIERSKLILQGHTSAEADEIAGPEPRAIDIRPPDIDKDAWGKMTEPEREHEIQRALDEQAAKAHLAEAEAERFDEEDAPAEAAQEQEADTTPKFTVGAEPEPEQAPEAVLEEGGEQAAEPEPEPVADKEKAREALEKYARLQELRKEMREIEQTLEKPPDIEAATPSSVDELRLKAKAMTDEELAQKLEEYGEAPRQPIDTSFYDAMSPHWNESDGNKLAGAATAGAASAIAAMVGDEVAARYDVRKLVDALGPEVGAMAVIARMKQDMSKERMKAWVDKLEESNATNQAATERKAMSRHRKLQKQREDLDRQIRTGDLASEATMEMLKARNLMEQRENLGTALGSLQASAALYHFGNEALEARWTNDHPVTINCGTSRFAVDDKLKRLGTIKASVDHHPVHGYQIRTTLSALRKFATKTEKNKADADRWRQVKYDTSGIQRDSEGREWVPDYKVGGFRSEFPSADHLPEDLAHLAGKPINFMADQRNNIEWIHGSGGGLVNMRTGGGKTLVSIGVAAKALEKDPQGRHLRVVPDGRQQQWADEIRTFTNIPVVELPQKSTKEQRARMIAEAPPGSIVLVGHTHAGRYDHEVLASAHEWGSVGIDEPQELRSKSGSGRLSAGAKRIFKIQAKNRHALTATPATEHAGEVYDIVNWARPGTLGYRTRFQGAFDGFGGGTNAQDAALQKMLYDELEPHVSGERLVAPHYGVTHQDHEVSMSDSQLSKQREIERRVDDTVQAAISEAYDKKRTGMRGYADKSYQALKKEATERAMSRLESEHRANLGGGSVDHNPKLAQMRDVIAKAKPGERHVVFVDSPEQRRAVTKMLEDQGHKGRISNITASAKGATRKVEGEQIGAIEVRKREWKGEQGGFILIDRTSASGHNLAEGDHLHILGNPDDAAQMLQAHGRLGRANREGDFTINTYKHDDSPFEHHHWNRLERQLKVLRATAPGMFTAGTPKPEQPQEQPRAAMAKGIRWLLRLATRRTA